jgi:hypothetical protein
MSEQGPRVYRAHIHWDYSGAKVFCHYGHVSACGQWVEAGPDTRWRLTADWFDSEAKAKASKAGEITALATKMLEQAHELLRAAEVAP